MKRVNGHNAATTNPGPRPDPPPAPPRKEDEQVDALFARIDRLSNAIERSTQAQLAVAQSVQAQAELLQVQVEATNRLADLIAEMLTQPEDVVVASDAVDEDDPHPQTDLSGNPVVFG